MIYLILPQDLILNNHIEKQLYQQKKVTQISICFYRHITPFESLIF